MKNRLLLSLGISVVTVGAASGDVAALTPEARGLPIAPPLRPARGL